MGKTAQGAVWLDRLCFSHFEFYQYWVNIDDRDVGRFLRLFTLLPLDEIRRLEALKDSGINEAKRILAYEATKITHGEKAADEAKAAFRRRVSYCEGDTGPHRRSRCRRHHRPAHDDTSRPPASRPGSARPSSSPKSA